MIPAVIYAARSAQQRDDDPRESTTSQIATVRARLGREPLDVFEESGYSGSRGNRGPALQAAIDMAVAAATEHGEAELWAFHSSRFGRGSGRLGEARALGKLFYDLRALGVTLRTVEDDEFVRNEQLIGIASSQAAKYAEDLGSYVSKGMRDAALRGDYMGRGIMLDGYTALREFDSRGRAVKTIIKDPDRKHIWELAWEMAQDGKSLQAIQLEFSGRGFRTNPVKKTHKARPFDINRLSQSLDNPMYAGIVVYKGETMPNPGNWEPYVSPEDFYRLRAERRARGPIAQASTGDRETTSRENGKRGGRPPVGYLLAKLATCGACGRRMRVQTSPVQKANGERSRRYVCQSHREHHRDSAEHCAAGPIDATVVDRMVVAEIGSLLANAESLRDRLLAGRRAERERLGTIAQEARQEAVAAERAAERAAAQHAAALKTADDDTLAILLAAAASERRAARRAMERADAALDAISTAADEPEDEEQDAVMARIWEALAGRVEDAAGDVRQLNAALHEWFEAFTLLQPERGVVWVGPVLSEDAVANVLRDPARFPSYGRGMTSAGEVLAGPSVLSSAHAQRTLLDLDEDQNRAVEGDQVELPEPRPVVAGQHLEAQPDEVLSGELFAPFSRGVPDVGHGPRRYAWSQM